MVCRVLSYRPDEYLGSIELHPKPPFEASLIFIDRRLDGTSSPLSQHELKLLPPQIAWNGASEHVPDAIATGLDAWAVSEKLRSVIDGLEPGKHQFIPVRLHSASVKTHSDLAYFILNPATLTHCLDYDCTPFIDVIDTLKPGTTTRSLKYPIAGMVFLESKVANRHFFRSWDGPTGGGDFCSQEFVVAYNAASCVGWRFSLCENPGAKGVCENDSSKQSSITSE